MINMRQKNTQSNDLPYSQKTFYNVREKTKGAKESVGGIEELLLGFMVFIFTIC